MATCNRGFSLIEVLIAILILGIGLLGVAGVQVLSLQNATNSEARTQANLFANELGERVRVDLPNAASYVTAKTKSCPAAGGLADWCEALQRTLVDAEYEVAWSAADLTLDIDLWWYERQMYGGSEAAPDGAEQGAEPEEPEGEVISHYGYRVRYQQ